MNVAATKTIRVFSSAARPTRWAMCQVPATYYGGAAGFEMVADLVEDGCRGLLKRLRKL